jgi:hypothetical protein
MAPRAIVRLHGTLVVLKSDRRSIAPGLVFSAVAAAKRFARNFWREQQYFPTERCGARDSSFRSLNIDENSKPAWSSFGVCALPRYF